MISTEQKSYWVIAGRKREDDFVDRVLPALGFSAEINPAKEQDIFAIDLLVEGKLADLKCQREPFYTVGKLDFDPQWTVTLNRNDIERYRANLELYFWIDWKPPKRQDGTWWPWDPIEAYGVTVAPMTGVWGTNMWEVKRKIERGTAPLHAYQKRVDDRGGNAKDSYLFDLRQMHYLKGSFMFPDEHWRPEDGQG